MSNSLAKKRVEKSSTRQCLKLSCTTTQSHESTRLGTHPPSDSTSFPFPMFSHTHVQSIPNKQTNTSIFYPNVNYFAPFRMMMMAMAPILLHLSQVLHYLCLAAFEFLNFWTSCVEELRAVREGRGFVPGVYIWFIVDFSSFTYETSIGTVGGS